MKTIVKIKKSGSSLRRLLRHIYLPEGPGGREASPILGDGNRVVGSLWGGPGGMTFNPLTDSQSLNRGLSGHRSFRHVIISMEDTTCHQQRVQATDILLSLADEFAGKFAPDVEFLAVVHDDRAHPHAHLVFRNEKSSGIPLCWDRSDLKMMQSMDWISPKLETLGVESGRGRGTRLPGFSDAPYPLAALDAIALAAESIDKLDEQLNTGILKIGSRNQRGEPTSVIWGNRPISIRTIRALGPGRKLGGQLGKINSRRMVPIRKSGPSIF